MAGIDLDRLLQESKEGFNRTAPVSRAALYEAKIEELRSSFARRAGLEVDHRQRLAPQRLLAALRAQEVA